VGRGRCLTIIDGQCCDCRHCLLPRVVASSIEAGGIKSWTAAVHCSMKQC
jgi:hypothetical protein